MNGKIWAISLTVLGLVGNGAATADNNSYSSVVTLCTGTCDSFAALDVGSTITGLIEINTTLGGTFGDADVEEFQFSVLNPALPLSGPVGDPVNDNPLVIDSSLGIAASNGTNGTTDAANELNGGQLLLEFLVPPFSSNGAYVVFDLSTGHGQICLFFETVGCLAGATEAVRFEGQFNSFSLSSVEFDPPLADFGQVMNDGAAQLDISATVVGSDNITFLGLDFPPADPFFISQDTCAHQSLPPGAGCTVTVDFQPTIEGMYMDSLGWSTNHGAGPIHYTLEGESVGNGGAVPDIPENLSGRAKRLHVNLRWSGSETATGFHVLRRLDTEIDFTDVGQSAKRVFVDDLPVGTGSAEYFVVAENAFGLSGDSQIIAIAPTSR